MKKHILLFASMMLSVMLSAQTQQGYVKTKGRMVNGQHIQGQGLKGATVCIKGKTAVVVKNDDGAFSFPVSEAQFRVDSVRKAGYQLVDMDALSKIYKHSANPIYLVMETREQMIEEQMDNFERINAAQQKLISTLRTEVKKLKTENKLTEEEYSRRLKEIADMQTESQQLVNEMVERYSKIDYDQLSESDLLISKYILNGELIKADSILRTKGDIIERTKQYKRDEAAIAKEKKELSQRQEQLQQSEALSIKRLEDLANDCYHKFEIHKLKHENDSAAYYLELRANMDSTNVEWQFQMGDFLYGYIADYQKALSYFHLGLQAAIDQYGEQNEWVASITNSIGVIYTIQGDFAKAMECFNKALPIWEAHGEKHPDLATCYSNVGIVYIYQGDYAKGLELFDKALSIYIAVYGDDHPEVAMSYHNIGHVFAALGNNAKAMEYINKALSIRKANYGEYHPEIASSYNNMGTVYNNMGDSAKALEFLSKALSIWEVFYGDTHRTLATCHDNIGSVYCDQGNYTKALEHYNMALSIRKAIYGENHPEVAVNYNNIGSLYNNQGDYDKALEYFNKALAIDKAITGENHPDVAICYSNIGFAYSKLGDLDKALEYMDKALSIRKAVLGENHPDVATSYNNIGSLYNLQGDHAMGLEYYNKALTIRKAAYGENHPRVADSYNNIGSVYYFQGDYAKALEHFRNALSILKTIYGEEHPSVEKTEKYILKTEYSQAVLENTLSSFCEDHCFIAVFDTSENQENPHGLSGEYILLELGDWNQNSPISLYDKDDELKGKAKDLVVMKDGVITQHHFEDSSDVQLVVKHVSKEEKRHINEAYEGWKRQYRKQP